MKFLSNKSIVLTLATFVAIFFSFLYIVGNEEQHIQKVEQISVAPVSNELLFVNIKKMSVLDQMKPIRVKSEFKIKERSDVKNNEMTFLSNGYSAYSSIAFYPARGSLLSTQRDKKQNKLSYKSNILVLDYQPAENNSFLASNLSLPISNDDVLSGANKPMRVDGDSDSGEPPVPVSGKWYEWVVFSLVAFLYVIKRKKRLSAMC